MNTCCSMTCEKRYECARHSINKTGLYASEDYSTFGSGSISAEGCKVIFSCGEAGEYKMFSQATNNAFSISLEAVKQQTALEILDIINEVCFSDKYKLYRIDMGSKGQRDLIIYKIKEKYGV